MTNPSGELSSEVEGWELSDGKGEQDQIVNGVWYRPMLGCDSLELAIDQAKREAEIKTAQAVLKIIKAHNLSGDAFKAVISINVLVDQIINQSEDK